jgi:aminoglycoside phosphotransferase (APT) family kinase protein
MSGTSMTGPPFTDDIDIDEALVRSILREQHPDLAGLGLREVAGGWDNRMWRLGEDLAVRLPRTPRGPSLLRTEQKWLPLLAPGLPLPVPVPVRVGEPSARFPRTWTVARWVDGEPADRAPISSPRAAGALAGFLTALHGPAPGWAPANPDRGIPLRTLRHDFDRCFPLVASSKLAVAARGAWELGVAAHTWEDAPVWIHGDLHPANVVVQDGTLSGVIDFGELCAGDPATDLAAAWLLLPSGAAARFFDAYANGDDATIRRARGWAVLRALHLIAIGHRWKQGLPGGKQTWGPAGWAALERIAASGLCHSAPVQVPIHLSTRTDRGWCRAA